jgi:hypothetical protein
VSVNNGSLERGHFSLVLGLPPFVDKPSVVLGRLTWKWGYKGHLRCLVKEIKRVDLESKQHPKESELLEFKWLLTFDAVDGR